MLVDALPQPDRVTRFYRMRAVQPRADVPGPRPCSVILRAAIRGDEPLGGLYAAARDHQKQTTEKLAWSSPAGCDRLERLAGGVHWLAVIFEWSFRGDVAEKAAQPKFFLGGAPAKAPMVLDP